MSEVRLAPTVLVVDDDPATCDLIQKLLTPLGYAVTTIGNGDDALTAAAAERPDLVIADIFLPGLDGLHVINALRQQDPLLPIIAISAVPDVLQRPEAVPAGLDLRSIPFLAKPFGLPALVALVQQLLPTPSQPRPGVPRQPGHGSGRDAGRSGCRCVG